MISGVRSNGPARSTNAKVALRVCRIGYLVPQSFTGTVHSVHSRACNIAVNGSLITLVAPELADGPTTLVLDDDRIDDARPRTSFEHDIDLRRCFMAGERVSCHNKRIEARAVDIDLTAAVRWRPDPRPAIGDPARIAANLHAAAARLAARLGRNASILQREGLAACTRLERACRDCDVDAALTGAMRLVGWGEGLTPAGDDFLVGLLAGLDALAGSPLATGSEARRAFLVRFADGVGALTGRTTALAAHHLRLAATGHFGADLHRLRNALLSSQDVARVEQLADDALAVGATSGSDLVAGLLAGVSAWLPSTDEPLA